MLGRVIISFGSVAWVKGTEGPSAEVGYLEVFMRDAKLVEQMEEEEARANKRTGNEGPFLSGPFLLGATAGNFLKQVWCI